MGSREAVSVKEAANARAVHLGRDIRVHSGS